MPNEFLSSPPAYEAASALEQALARVVAHVRAEFVAEKRAMDAELKLAHAELGIVTDRIAQAHNEFARWLADVQRMQVDVRGERGEPGARGEPGQEGAPGAAGERGTEGAPGRDGAPGPAGERGAAGQDGAPGLAGDRGLDGALGRDGRDGLQGPIGANGKDGRDGVDGKDGLGFDDARQFCDAANFGIEFYRAGDVIRKFTWPLPTLADHHCGAFVVGASYKRGQCATFGGSTYLCLRDTDQKPKQSEDWRPIAEHGLPGRSGKDGERGAPGPAGRDGRDLTQMTATGLKYG
jgi:hypothetical protein